MKLCETLLICKPIKKLGTKSISCLVFFTAKNWVLFCLAEKQVKNYVKIDTLSESIQKPFQEKPIVRKCNKKFSGKYAQNFYKRHQQVHQEKPEKIDHMCDACKKNYFHFPVI